GDAADDRGSGALAGIVEVDLLAEEALDRDRVQHPAGARLHEDVGPPAREHLGADLDVVVVDFDTDEAVELAIHARAPRVSPVERAAVAALVVPVHGEETDAREEVVLGASGVAGFEVALRI